MRDYTNGQKAGYLTSMTKPLDKQNKNFARASRFFVHFFVLVERLQRESA